MAYHTRFGLEYNPFIKNKAKDVLIETSEYRQCVTRLNHLVNIGGFGLVTGEAGLGKTSTLRYWTNTLSKSLYDVIYISLSTITVDQFYYILAEELGLEPEMKKTKNYKNIQRLIKNIAVEKRKIPVIILDEANYMASSILNDLKMLFNFDMDSKDYAVIILAGLPNLSNTLALKSNEPLRQRVVMSYQLDTIKLDEAKDYVLEKLKQAGCHHEVFTESALHSITSTANGTLRVINQICNTCLMIADNKEQSIINEELVLSAIDEIQI